MKSAVTRATERLDREAYAMIIPRLSRPITTQRRSVLSSVTGIIAGCGVAREEPAGSLGARDQDEEILRQQFFRDGDQRLRSGLGRGHFVLLR